jgi:hypothetical protein
VVLRVSEIRDAGKQRVASEFVSTHCKGELGFDFRLTGFGSKASLLVCRLESLRVPVQGGLISESMILYFTRPWAGTFSRPAPSCRASRIVPHAREETPESRRMRSLFLNTERGFGGKPSKKSGFRRHLAGSKMPKETYFTAISRWRMVSRRALDASGFWQG